MLHILLLSLLSNAICGQENNAIYSLIQKYKTLNSISYQFKRKVTSGNKSTFHKGKVSLVPFGEFEVRFFFPTVESYIFDGKILKVIRDGKTIEKKIGSDELRTLQLLTCFFIYYLRDDNAYSFVEKKGSISTYKYEASKDHREILYFDELLCIPKEISVEFLDSTTKIIFSNTKNFGSYIIPTKISTRLESKKDFTKNITEEIYISNLNFERD